MENIQQFIALISSKGGVAKKNRFKIKISLNNALAPLSASGDQGRDLSLLCESISFPNKALTSIDYSLWRNPIKIPTGFTHDDVNIVFHLTNDYYVKNIFDSWLNSIVNTETYIASYDEQYKTTVEIFQLDEQDRIIYGVQLNDAYPISISGIELDNKARNETQKLSVDFTYSTWVPIGGLIGKLDNYVGDINFTPDAQPTNLTNFDARIT